MGKRKPVVEQDGVWRTIGGRRVFIRNGQSLSDAMKESGKFRTTKSGNVRREDVVKGKAELMIDFERENQERFKKLQKYAKTKKDKKDYAERIYESEQNENNAGEYLELYQFQEEYSGDRSKLKGKHISNNVDVPGFPNYEYNLETGDVKVKENEAEKYYSKLGQYQAREDLDMRKSWLDDNVYAPDKRKEYEDFYKQGEKYYKEKYEKPKNRMEEDDALANSYWNGNGKYGKYANYLTDKDDDELINQMGIPKKLVDEYHEEGRRYYRWFNDGVLPHKKTLDGQTTYSGYLYKLPYGDSTRKMYENIYAKDMDTRMDRIFEKMQDAEIKTGFEVGQINKPIMLRYGDTIDYLKSTTNMNTSQILEILKQMDANR